MPTEEEKQAGAAAAAAERLAGTQAMTEYIASLPAAEANELERARLIGSRMSPGDKAHTLAKLRGKK